MVKSGTGCVHSIKERMAQINLSMKGKQTHRHREQTCGCQGGRGGGGGRDWEFGVSRCKLSYTRWINNKVLPYSTENYIQYPMINHKGKEHKKKNVYICITESLCCTAEINTTLKIRYTSIEKKKERH